MPGEIDPSQLAELDAGFETLLEHAEDLSPFAWRFRYPGEVLDPGEAEARRAAELAGEALDFVLERVPEEARPKRGNRSAASTAAAPAYHEPAAGSDTLAQKEDQAGTEPDLVGEKGDTETAPEE